jgi:hypothetical protein
LGISYRFIGTYSTDTGNSWNWGGPASGVAFAAPGTSTPWGDAFGVSDFDMGSTFGTGSTDLLNTTSGFGSDELDLTSLLATTSSYSVTDAPVFNWNGDAAIPGFGCDNFSVSVAGGDLSYQDKLAGADWGLVRDYEVSLNVSGYSSFSVTEQDFQDASFQIIGGSATSASSPGGSSTVYLDTTQRGSFDLSQTG